MNLTEERPASQITIEQNVANSESGDLEAIIPGRMNRVKYLCSMLIIGLVGGVFVTIWNYISPNTSSVPIILVEIATLLPVVKRLHDIDRSGAWFWAMLIPGFNIFLSFMLLFLKGTVGPNQFGDDPLQNGVDERAS